MKDVKTNSHLARVAMTLTLLICVMTGAWADDITAEQAREQALSFIQQHKASSGKTNRVSPSATLPMTMTQVNGLYVFNIADDQGFVIVSNDDRTTPILGFSDNGSIDPDNMPSNMRAWLQGYADEIAWLQKNGGTAGTRTALAKTSSWNVGDTKTDISPLIETTWNQGEPYNNLCPKDAQGKMSITGCAATAMAQVMKYYQWPTGETAAIPAYKDEYGMDHDGLPATTFDWGKMLDNYVEKNGDEKIILGSDVEQTAVAKLMQYCGWAVKMSYSSSFSGAYAHDVPYALKTYFNYDETAQYVNRSFYSYANWMDLIYYELAHDRPVVYSASSSRGGHAFVCDGYQYEKETETDYFHINWGWGGVNDEYYVLSVLNPYAQGAGGSSSNDGFYYGQGAVIGIQPYGGTGTVANITTNVINLTLNSVTLSSNPVVVGTPVTVTFNITNNSTDAYDGTIQLGVTSEGSTILAVGNHIEIPAGQTNVCTITYTPNKIGTYTLNLFIPSSYLGFYECCLGSHATLIVVEEGTSVIILNDVAANNTSVVNDNNNNPTNVLLDGRTLWKDGYWNTLCLPFDVEDGDDSDNLTFSGTPLAGAEARTLTSASITGTTLNLTFGDAVTTLVAGTPYIIKWESGTNIVDPVFTGVTIDKTKHNYDNGATGEGRVRFLGTYDKKVFTTDDPSILFLGAGNSLYYPQPDLTDAENPQYPSIGACRAYFKIGDDAASARTITDFNIDFGEEDVTGIEELKDGKIEELKLEGWYTLTGVKLEGKPTEKGVYIYKGKKIAIK